MAAHECMPTLEPSDDLGPTGRISDQAIEETRREWRDLGTEPTSRHGEAEGRS